jgi:2-polyprenyl-3-methyl-5-hydroxy-6-metoxy-1,4-benzoquinol methylase
VNLDLVEKCPLCGNFQDFTELVNAGEDGILVKCQCGLRFARKRIKIERLKYLCEGYMPSAFNTNNFTARFRQAHEDLRIIEKYMDIGNMYDVCAGSGAFMKCANDRGWAVGGNDLSAICCLLAFHKWSVRINNCELRDVDTDEVAHINAVTMCNAIEHLRLPLEELANANSMMRSGGIIFVRTPEFSDEQLKEDHQLPYHFFDYDSITLKKMLEKTGFEILFCEVQVGENDTIICVGRKV